MCHLDLLDLEVHERSRVTTLAEEPDNRSVAASRLMEETFDALGLVTRVAICGTEECEPQVSLARL